MHYAFNTRRPLLERWEQGQAFRRETPQNERIVLSGRRPAPAKLNATLEVLTKRPDGYHALRSVAIPIALYDEIVWTPAPEFRFSCSDSKLCNDANLAVLAAAEIGLDALGIMLHLEKRIPYGSGLGGGSSDAAAVLLAAMDGAFGPQPARDWLAVARSLGSDVPLFLVDAPALIEATGERVTALGANAPWWTVLFCPPFAVATRDAYARLDADTTRSIAGSRAGSVSVAMAEALQRRDFLAVERLLSNDFEAALFARVEFSPVRDAFAAIGRTPHLTGSGSACFTLFEDELSARGAATTLQALATDARVFAVPFAASAAWRQEA